MAGTWWRVLAGRGAASMWRAVAAPHVCPGVNLCMFHCARRTRNRTMPAPPALAQLDLLLLSWTKSLHNSVMSARLLGDAGRKLAQDRRTKIRLHTEHICFIRTKGQDPRKLTADQAHVIVRKCGCIALARDELHAICPAARPISLDMRIVVAASAARFLDAAKMSPGIKLFGDTPPPSLRRLPCLARDLSCIPIHDDCLRAPTSFVPALGTSFFRQGRAAIRERSGHR